MIMAKTSGGSRKRYPNHPELQQNTIAFIENGITLLIKNY